MARSFDQTTGLRPGFAPWTFRLTVRAEVRAGSGVVLARELAEGLLVGGDAEAWGVIYVYGAG